MGLTVLLAMLMTLQLIVLLPVPLTLRLTACLMAAGDGVGAVVPCTSNPAAAHSPGCYRVFFVGGGCW